MTWRRWTLSASLLGMPGLSETEREEMVEMIHGKVQEVVDTLARSAEYFALDVPGETDRLPVDSYPVFEAAVHTLDSLARNQGVRLQVRKPELMSCESSPRLLIYSASSRRPDAAAPRRRPQSELAIEIVENAGFVCYSLPGRVSGGGGRAPGRISSPGPARGGGGRGKPSPGRPLGPALGRHRRGDQSTGQGNHRPGVASRFCLTRDEPGAFTERRARGVSPRRSRPLPPGADAPGSPGNMLR